jgi:polar amino acid transport system permease protein
VRRVSDDLSTLVANTGNFLSGLQITLLATVLGTVLMLVLSIVLGLMARSHRLLVRGFARTVIEFFRGTSLLVQLWWLFYALPLMGLILDPLFCGVLALGLNYGAYGAEVVRGSINAVPRPQWEAAIALSLSPWHRMRRVIWPQAIALMIPSFNNLFIQLLKSTPLLFTITLTDFMFVADSLRLSGTDEAVIYTAVLLVYLILAYAFTLLFSAAEVRANKRLGRHEGLVSVFRSLRATRAADAEVSTVEKAGRA